MWRRFIRLWVVWSVVHFLILAVCATQANQVMNVTREPSALTVAALGLARILLFPALPLWAGSFELPVVVAVSLLWGLCLACLVMASTAVVTRLRCRNPAS
jgi:hypothetical protein